MSLLKSLLNDINENAAASSTGAHAIATTPGSLFNGGVVDGNKKSKKKKYPGLLRRVDAILSGTNTNIRESLNINDEETKFDASDVISKIEAAQKKSDYQDDTVAFGLEDEEGGTVKVYVKTEQAKDFEHSLQQLLSNENQSIDNVNQNSSPEIAEILYELKDKFDIVNVEWPTISGDEEEEQEIAPEAEGEAGDDFNSEEGKEGGDDAGKGEELDLEGGDEKGEGGEDDKSMIDDEGPAVSALQNVIDVMKADAEAKKAEADARKAEANADEAKHMATSSAMKVRQEEQVLDMEAYDDGKRKQEQETKQLAKLAKYQHDKASDMEDDVSAVSVTKDISFESAEENEETAVLSDPYRRNHTSEEESISTSELTTLLLKNLGAN